jgi:nucleotide-binding universal stress UspA family protein
MLTKIFVPVDTSTLAEQALPVAARIAKAAHASLVVALVHQPMPGAGYPDAPWNGARLSMETAYLDAKAHELADRFAIEVTTDHVTGPVVETIARLADAHGADIVVMTTHGRTGLSRAWLGSVADAVMRSLETPVLMLHPTAEAGANQETLGLFQRVLVPLDGSPGAECILSSALSIAGPDANFILARIVQPLPPIVNAVDPYTMSTFIVDPEATKRMVDCAKEYINGVAARLAQRGVKNVEEWVAVSDHVAPALLDLAKHRDLDLIAVPTRGRGNARFLLGSVADKILRGSTIPLLLRRRVDRP